MKYKYDPEADVLAVTMSNKSFDYAEELGDFVVHFDKKNRPVYIEILNASKFLINAANKFPKPFKKEFFQNFA
jgi:uncharacterized protein YuzE